jgi:hypothetical protein
MKLYGLILMVRILRCDHHILLRIKDIKMRPSHFIEDNSNGWLPSEVRVQVILEPYPCEQIKVAEESVAKAKEALKAAENALKVVKEGK